MSHQTIIEAVGKSIDMVCSEFRSHPARFFTESDIVCRFYAILQEELPMSKAIDKDGHEHFLVHREYPTPFRCDMSDGKFEVKDDDARTERGGKYRRGHYDVVVLDPDFVGRHPYEVIRAQDYQLYQDEVVSQVDSHGPPVLYGLEFMYRRDPLRYSGGSDGEKAIEVFRSRVKQDADKLLASRHRGFMDQIRMLTFVKGSSKEICSVLRDKLSRGDEIVLCFSDQAATSPKRADGTPGLQHFGEIRV